MLNIATTKHFIIFQRNILNNKKNNIILNHFFKIIEFFLQYHYNTFYEQISRIFT